ncbi:hypothetical protein AX769_20200 [Frondihabitans sp. PAMC 28766]|nr:hypothetical protein AX769_20200 [Frondihabitans sp. PAMC 28766]
MKEFRDDIRRRAEGFGRDPDEIKVFFVILPLIADTIGHAQEMSEAWNARGGTNFEISMSHVEATQEIDRSQFDLDQQLPTGVSTNGHQSTLENTKGAWGDRTIREAASGGRTSSVPLIGMAESVADEMEAIMAEVGGDSFLIHNQSLSRTYTASIIDDLAPALKHQLLRDSQRDMG